MQLEPGHWLLLLPTYLDFDPIRENVWLPQREHNLEEGKLSEYDLHEHQHKLEYHDWHDDGNEGVEVKDCKCRQQEESKWDYHDSEVHLSHVERVAVIATTDSVEFASTK